MTICARPGAPCLLFLVFLLLISLPLHSAASDAKPLKVGLALSGGGARGAAHIGVLKVLEREGIPIDYIAGTSFGSIVGGLYALGYSADEIEQIFTRQDWGNLFSDAPERRLSPLTENRDFRYQGQLSFQGLNPELPTGLWGGQKLIEVLNSLTVVRMLAAQDDFDRLPIPFRAIATDLLTGEPYIFRKGRMSEALLASSAIPMILTPVEKDGMLLVDGGLSDNLPTDIVRDMGADLVIAVDATSALLQKKEIRSFLDVMDQSVSILMKKSVDRNRNLASLTVKPDLDGYTYRDYLKTKEIIALGEKEAEKRVADLRALVAGIPPRWRTAFPSEQVKPVVDSVSFEGARRVEGRQLNREVKSKPGKAVNSNVLREDLRRLYATHLFSQVDCNLEPAGNDRYRLIYLLKESPPHTLGASIRFEREDKFVALVEATGRQLFGSPSTATISSQFGGIEDHSATLRYVPPGLPFLFMEPKIQLRRRERSDFREGHLADHFTDRRAGGQLAFGGTLFKRLEVEAAYRDDRITIGGGSTPNRLDGSLRLAGPVGRVNRDTLDAPDYPRTGSALRFQLEKRVAGLGSDLSYSRYQADIERYFSPTTKSTILVRTSAGYSRGPVPFFDRFYAGGFSYSESGPRRFVGFDRDELAANQMAILTLGYRRLLLSRPLSFTRRAFLTFQYNSAAMSDREKSPYNFGFVNGAALGLALDTLLGPMRVAAAWGEGGRAKFYLSLGPAF